MTAQTLTLAGFLAALRKRSILNQTSERRAILAALAEADGQDMDFFDLGHTAEIMYGREADEIEAAR